MPKKKTVTGEDERLRHIHVRISDREIRAVGRLTDEHGMGIAEIIRQAVNQWAGKDVFRV